MGKRRGPAGRRIVGEGARGYYRSVTAMPSIQRGTIIVSTGFEAGSRDSRYAHAPIGIKAGEPFQ